MLKGLKDSGRGRVTSELFQAKKKTAPRQQRQSYQHTPQPDAWRELQRGARTPPGHCWHHREYETVIKQDCVLLSFLPMFHINVAYRAANLVEYRDVKE